MTSSTAIFFDELGSILGVCPCCANLFHLSEARPYLDGRKQKSIVDTLRTSEARLDREEEKLNEAEAELREKAAQAGLKAAKKLLKKIDVTFSNAGYDPHDVKVIFNPVPYVIFRGMSKKEVKKVTFLAKPPENAQAEKVYKSIENTIQKGAYDFRVIRVGNDGTIDNK